MNSRTRLVAGLGMAGAAAGAMLLAYRLYAESAKGKMIRPIRDYSNRSGFPRPPGEMRGLAARKGAAPAAPRA